MDRHRRHKRRAPQWAGLVAEADQGAHSQGVSPLDGPSQTIPEIYSFGSAFHDVTTGSNGYRSGRGYDVATGLGTPIVYVLEGDLAFHVNWNYAAIAAPRRWQLRLRQRPLAAGRHWRCTASVAERSSRAAWTRDQDHHRRWLACPVEYTVDRGHRSRRSPAQVVMLDGHPHPHDRAIASLLDGAFAMPAF